MDTLALSTSELAPLKDLLANDAVKILHAGSQDLEIFWQVFEILPTPYLIAIGRRSIGLWRTIGLWHAG